MTSLSRITRLTFFLRLKGIAESFWKATLFFLRGGAEFRTEQSIQPFLLSSLDLVVLFGSNLEFKVSLEVLHGLLRWVFPFDGWRSPDLSLGTELRKEH
jgi:hypothetical protein